MLEWVPWREAADAAGGTAATWALTSRSRSRAAGYLLPWAKELTLVLVLYTIWQYAGAWSITRASEAVARGRWIWHLERSLRLPSEESLQALFLGHHEFLRLLNEYYAWVHVPAVGVCLVWLFVRHRRHYPKVRTVIALVTGASLVIQLIPVAPPRLVPGLGMVDTAALIGPNEYASGAPGIDQLSTMPSLHVAWALIVGGSIVWVCRSRWRWLGLAHPVITILAVVVTGNHYWADANVAGLLVAVASLIVARIYRPVPAEEAVPALVDTAEPEAGELGGLELLTVAEARTAAGPT